MTYKLNHDELYNIAQNIIYSKHAKLRLAQRLHIQNDHARHGQLFTMILDSPLAYENTDGCINIAINKYEYLVVAPRENDYFCITFKEKSRNGHTVLDKYKLALKGVLR